MVSVESLDGVNGATDPTLTPVNARSRGTSFAKSASISINAFLASPRYVGSNFAHASVFIEGAWPVICFVVGLAVVAWGIMELAAALFEEMA